MTSKKYRLRNADQAYLFPPSMRDWLEEDHLVYRLLDVVESLDIRSVSHSIHAKNARGARPYNPRVMVALLLYSTINGIYSSRQIAASTYSDGSDSRYRLYVLGQRNVLRGVIKVRAEWTLVCLCHNLIKLLAAQPGLATA